MSKKEVNKYMKKIVVIDGVEYIPLNEARKINPSLERARKKIAEQYLGEDPEFYKKYSDNLYVQVMEYDEDYPDAEGLDKFVARVLGEES